MMEKTIAVIGLGLIGGSLALGLKENGFAKMVIGVENKPEHIIKSLELGLVDKVMLLDDAVKMADIIIVAVPVNALTTLLPYILDKIDNQIVIDVGSTKRAVIEAVKMHPKRSNFVATHPMAGTEFSGPEAAIRGLFDGKNCAFCDITDSSADAVHWVEQLYKSLKMNLIYIDGNEHDVHLAYISHISHISSFALALTVLEKEKDENRIFELASTGFSSTVRLAKSNPDTWIPIFRQNADNIMDVLDEYINTLLKFKGLMLSDGYEKFRQYLEHANDIKRILK